MFESTQVFAVGKKIGGCHPNPPSVTGLVELGTVGNFDMFDHLLTA